MLVLKRKEAQWLEVRHRSGDVLRICISKIEPGRVNLAFEDDARHFDIERPERLRPPVAGYTPVTESLRPGGPPE